MKIGIFTDSYRPYTSGVVRSIETYADELRALGHEIFIFAPRYKNCSEEEGIFRFPSVPAPTNRDFALAIPFSLKFKSLITKWRPDVIHVHSPFLLGQVGARYARKLKVPLVFTFHTLYDQYVHYVPFAQNLTREITKRLCRSFCNKCDLVIVPTSVIGKHIRSMGVHARIKTIPTGIKVEEFRCGHASWLRQRYHIPPEEKILLFVGRLGKEKNIEFLLSSFAQLVLEFPEVKLVLVGGGPEEGNLKKKAHQLGIAEKVVFTGVLPKHEVINCYLGADVFVFSSKTETQGLVLAEAKAAGLPVVAVRAFGTEEMVRDGEDGFLTPEDKTIFTLKIKEILSSAWLRQKMSKEARKNAQLLSSRQAALALVEEYRVLIGQNQSKLP